MSLQAIAGVAYERRNDRPPTPVGGRTGLETAELGPDGQPRLPTPSPATTMAPSAAPQSAAKQFNGALETLKRYIPTEFLALYLPFLAIAKDRGPQAGDVSLLMYAGFVIATPIAVYLIYLAKAAESGTSDAWKSPPLFECILATIAFAVWGASVPGMFAGQQWWIALLAMASAFVLPLLDSIFGKKPAKR